MEKVSTKMSNAHITNDDVVRVVSGGLQHRFSHERHAVKRIAKILDTGLSRAKQILYGEAAPTTAQMFQLMRELEPDFSATLIKTLAGHDLTNRDREKAIAIANQLEQAAEILRQQALSHEEKFNDGCGHF